jgi:hypothetical protein
LVLARISGGDIIWWPQAHAALISVIILPVTPALPSIDNIRVHRTMVDG